MSMKNNQLNNKSISDYYTVSSDDNDSMLAQYDDRASHHSNTTRNSSNLFYKFLKTSSKILNYIFYNIAPIGLSVFWITVVIASFYKNNITFAIIAILVLIVNILTNFSNPPNNK